MKLIDLLVKELPKHGWWPEGADVAIQRNSGVIEFIGQVKSSNCRGECWVAGTIKSIMIDDLGAGYANTIITKEEYEKALQESKPKAIGKMIPADGNSWVEFEFISITPTETNGKPAYICQNKDGKEYHCLGRYWIPEMYEQKSDKELLEEFVVDASKKILDTACDLAVKEMVERAIKEFSESFGDLNKLEIKYGFATKKDGAKYFFTQPYSRYDQSTSLIMNAADKHKTNEAPISKVDGVDFVNHPPHYQSDNGIECIDAIRAALGKDGFISHCRGTAIKYLYRAPNKDAQLQDLKKAAWYVRKAIEEIEGLKCQE